MPVAARVLASTLEHKFRFDPIQGRHTKYRLVVDGQWVANTQVSHGWGEISDQMLAKIARQLGVSRKQLQLMVDCSISRDAYISLIT